MSEDVKPMAWLCQLLAPGGPMELVDGEGQRWRATPCKSGRFSYSPCPTAPEAVPEAARAEAAPPPLALRPRGYAPKTQPPVLRHLGLELPSKASTYVPLRALGSGSFGQVCLASASDGALVAIKRARKGFDKYLVHEAAVMSEVPHDCVAACLDFFWDAEKQPCLVLKLARGTLHELLLGPASATATLHALEAVRSGLRALHAVRFVHLDLTPRNVLVHHDGAVRLADMGSAQREGEEVRDLYVGTRKYRCPELLLGARCVDRRMDLWSLGVVALELALRSDLLLRAEDSLQQLLAIVALLGPPTNLELRSMLPGWEPARFDGPTPSQGTLREHLSRVRVLDAPALQLALPLLAYDPEARSRGLRSWPKITRRLRARPRAPAS